MALYSSETSLDCHRVRFVLAEKGINVDIVNVSEDESAAADLAELNPYNEAPTLVDRDLVLYAVAFAAILVPGFGLTTWRRSETESSPTPSSRRR